jgi:hypothetical protein
MMRRRFSENSSPIFTWRRAIPSSTTAAVSMTRTRSAARLRTIVLLWATRRSFSTGSGVSKIARYQGRSATELEQANRATDGTLVACAEYLELVATVT